MDQVKQDEVRAHVRKVYENIAQSAGWSGGCCSASGETGATGAAGTTGAVGASDSCCGTSPSTVDEKTARLGYSEEEIRSVPEGANMGLGCGNPQAIAELKPGETVMDLGSGGGFDCFLAARQLNGSGRVIGVDMTPEMISIARSNAARGGYTNVEFRLGEIENLPVGDATVDAILSNCVINLSPDKRRVFEEAFRVLKPGGRLAVSDVVAMAPLPEELARDLALYSGCVSGAATVDELRRMLTEQGFLEVSIEPKDASREYISEWAPGSRVEDYVASAVIRARKPG